MKALLNPTTDELNFIDVFRRSSNEAKELAVEIMKDPSFISKKFCMRKTFISDFVEAFDNGSLNRILDNIIVMM